MIVTKSDIESIIEEELDNYLEEAPTAPALVQKTAQIVASLLPQNSIVAGIAVNTLPLWIANFGLFLSLKKSPLVVTPTAYRRAAYYIGQYLRQTGARSIYSYKVYYNAQRLDPKYKNNPEPTYTYKNWSKASTNPYVHMSVGFGKAGVTFNNDGSVLIKDRYDFNVLRGGGERVQDYVISLSNYWKGFKKAFNLLGQGRIFAAVEELCVWYELTLRYKGYPISLKSITRKEAEAVGR